MTAFMRTVFVAGLLIGLAAPFAAAQDQDVEGSKDHPLISRYPGSYIAKYLTKEFDEFALPLGPVDVENTITKNQPLEGKITRIVYVAPSGRTVLEVFRNYQDALTKAGFETLFTCGPQGCGSTVANAYANSGDNLDYWGPQRGIHYVSAKLARPEGDVYVSLLIDDQGPDSRESIAIIPPITRLLATATPAAIATLRQPFGGEPQPDAARTPQQGADAATPGRRTAIYFHDRNLAALAGNGNSAGPARKESSFAARPARPRPPPARPRAGERRPSIDSPISTAATPDRPPPPIETGPPAAWPSSSCRCRSGPAACSAAGCECSAAAGSGV